MSTVDDLRALGVEPGDVLVVHCAFSKVRTGGPLDLIAALRDALGPEGTLVMPSMSDLVDVVFDPETSPCRDMGVVADTFRRLPGVMRSDSPHAFAAIGPLASRIVAPHPIDVPHGPDSPPGRVADLDGRILLLGVGQDANTTIHVAENQAGVRYRIRHHVTVAGIGRVDYDEVDSCSELFALVDEWLTEAGALRRGTVGSADARLMRSRDVIDVVVPRLRADEAIFLHEPGHDADCDAARASLPGR